MSKPTNRLNPKQQLFVDEYMRTFSPKKAALFAGYSENNPSKVGYNVLQSPSVQAEIQKETEKRKSVLNRVPFDYIVQTLVEMVGDDKLKHTDRMRAIELLLKYKEKNGWSADEAKNVNDYVEALKGNITDVWTNTSGEKSS